MRTTPTGVPVTLCDDCGVEHPMTRHHCATCGRASLFLDAAGACLRCVSKDLEAFELIEPTY